MRDEDGNAISGDLLTFVRGKTGLPIERVLHTGAALADHLDRNYGDKP